MAEQPYPPLVPEGETFENLQELLQNISIQSLINCVAFSPDGKAIVSEARDNSGRLGRWQPTKGSPPPHRAYKYSLSETGGKGRKKIHPGSTKRI